MNAALDILSDQIPHGTVEGFHQGCKTHHCPAPMACVDVASRYAGDYGFKKAIDSGLTAADVLARELSESVQAKSDEVAERRVARSAERKVTKPKATPERVSWDGRGVPDPTRAMLMDAMVVATDECRLALEEYERTRAVLLHAITALIAFDQPVPPKRGPGRPRKTEALQPQAPIASVRSHGRAGFKAGCRCEVCRDANRSYARDYYRRTKGAAS